MLEMNCEHHRAIKFISQLRSDIFSLQETNKDMVRGFVKALNAEHGDVYDFIWDPRNHNDGCGTIYNKKLLSLDSTIITRYDSGNHIIQATKFTHKVGRVNNVALKHSLE